MESDEECDAYAAVIVAAAVIEPEKQPNATARGGYIRTDCLSVDAADQASLMFSSVKGK